MAGILLVYLVGLDRGFGGVSWPNLQRLYGQRCLKRHLFDSLSVQRRMALPFFSGTTIQFELSGLGIYQAMENGGTSAAAFALLENLPCSVIVIPLFLLTAILSYITSASGNINAIAGLCTTGLTSDDSESPPALQVIWGLTIGAMCMVMLIAFDIEGVKTLAYIGGLPIVF